MKSVEPWLQRGIAVFSSDKVYLLDNVFADHLNVARPATEL